MKKVLIIVIAVLALSAICFTVYYTMKNAGILYPYAVVLYVWYKLLKDGYK